jgi:hypothetical protein
VKRFLLIAIVILAVAMVGSGCSKNKVTSPVVPSDTTVSAEKLSIKLTVSAPYYYTFLDTVKTDSGLVVKTRSRWDVTFTIKTTGSPLKCNWSFGDNKTETYYYDQFVKELHHVYTRKGTFNVIVWVQNEDEFAQDFKVLTLALPDTT